MEFKEFVPLEKSKNLYKKRKKSIRDSLLALFSLISLGFITYLFLKDSNEKINRIRLENKELQVKFDSINNVNKGISIQLDKFQNKIDSLKGLEKQLSIKYQENKQQIKNTQKKYEKNNRIDNFSSPDIISYFTDSI
jgi:TolA-binding protein